MRIHGESLALLRVSAHDSYGLQTTLPQYQWLIQRVPHPSSQCDRTWLGRAQHRTHIRQNTSVDKAAPGSRTEWVRPAISTESRKKSFRAAIARFAFANRRMRRAGYAMWVMDATEKTMLHFGQVPPLSFFFLLPPLLFARAQAHSPLSLLSSRTLIYIALGKLTRT